MFYGLQWQTIKSKELDGSKVTLKSQIMVGQIMADIKFGELYHAWEHAFNTLVEDFLTPNGYTNSAFLSVSFKTLPKMLTFQLNRVVYQDGGLRKLHDKFEFPKILYPDRFLYANRRLKRKLRQRHIQLLSQLRTLEDRLQLFKEYNGKNLPEWLGLSAEFIQFFSQNSRFELDKLSNAVSAL